jgi:hypothetical protein
MPTKLTNEIITAAIEGFEAQKARIDGQILELRGLLNGNPAARATTPGVPAPKRKRFSAATRRRMKQAQQRRWAEAAKTKPAVAKKASTAGKKTGAPRTAVKTA